MAKIKLDSCDNLTQAQKEVLRKDDTTNDKFVATCDEEAQSILSDILTQLGGSGSGGDTTATISNLAMGASGNEIEVDLPANTKRFFIRSRKKGVLNVAYVTSGPYVTVPKGANYSDDNFYTDQSVFVSSSKNNDTLELITFV